MTRPLSIARYEALYLAALALGLVNTALGWSQSVERFAANPAVSAPMMWMLPATAITGFVLRVALWYFTARRPSRVAKWIVVALAAVSIVVVLMGLVALVSGASASIAAIAGLASGVLYVAAAVYLFQPDARAWFGESDPIEQEPSA